MVPPKERMAILRKCEYIRYAPDTLMTIDAVLANIDASIERGWFLNDNGFEPDLIGIAMPVPVTDRQLRLIVAGPAYRTRSRVPRFVEQLRGDIHTSTTGQTTGRKRRG